MPPGPDRAERGGAAVPARDDDRVLARALLVRLLQRRLRPYCKDAYARYRADRRTAGKDDPRGLRSLDTDRHIPADWFRLSVWLPALKAANLPLPRWWPVSSTWPLR